MPKTLESQSFRYFTISEFANQNSVSANYPKIFFENLLIEKAKVSGSRLLTLLQVRAVDKVLCLKSIYYMYFDSK
jgi:hypothetical protein